MERIGAGLAHKPRIHSFSRVAVNQGQDTDPVISASAKAGDLAYIIGFSHTASLDMGVNGGFTTTTRYDNASISMVGGFKLLTSSDVGATVGIANASPAQVDYWACAVYRFNRVITNGWHANTSAWGSAGAAGGAISKSFGQTGAYFIVGAGVGGTTTGCRGFTATPTTNRNWWSGTYIKMAAWLSDANRGLTCTVDKTTDDGENGVLISKIGVR